MKERKPRTMLIPFKLKRRLLRHVDSQTRFMKTKKKRTDCRCRMTAKRLRD